MFDISRRSILEKASADSYHRGIKYFEEGRVKSVKFDQEKLHFYATVLGSSEYDTETEFDKSGMLRDAVCSCPAYLKDNGYCKHIVALLIFIQDRDGRGFFGDLKFRKAAKYIFDLFQSRPSVPKTAINIEFTYEYRAGSGYGSGSLSSLSMRVGLDKLYVVRNVKKFVEAVKSNQSLEFGKGFTYDPVVHEFKAEDCPLIDFLKEIYDNDRILDTMGNSPSRPSVFMDKQVCLSDSGIKRFFELMGHRSFKAQVNDCFYDDMQILYRDFPVKFLLAKEGNDLMLHIDNEIPLFPLTEEGKYFFCKDAIYRISLQQQENFKPFFMAMAYQKSRRLRFIEEDKERFVSEILPFAEKAGKLEITEEVRTIMEKLPLDAEIYLDKSGEGISAEVKFIYGERAINPFAPIDRTAYRSEKIFIRDMEKEGVILDTLGQLDFKVRENKVFLCGEEEIYEFVFHLIPGLQEWSSIFYSEAFKAMAIRSCYSLSGRVNLNHGSDLLEFTFQMEGVDPGELWDIFLSLRQKKKYYRLKNGGYLSLDSQELHDISRMLELLDVEKKDLEKGSIQLPKYRALVIDQQIRNAGLHFIERSHAFKEVVQNIREPEDMDFEIPVSLGGVLREYQKFGFKWLKTLSKYGLGGILADDMGLGKTLQVITLILSEQEEAMGHPSLVVAPTSLVYNWMSEIEKFAPGLNVLIISGSRAERIKLLERVREAEVVITSYPLIRRDVEEYRELQFRYCILDEAQHIKNPHSQNALSVKKIPSHRRYALTGTPIENSLTELWSIFDFILPGFLYSHLRFTEKYELPVSRGEGEKPLFELSQQIRPFILRRLKKDVLKELPEKIEHKMTAEMTGEQKKVYMAYLQSVRGELTQEIAARGFEKSQMKILAALTRLRQICCHPSLFLEGFEGESGKLQLLKEILQEALEAGHRILLFSQFTGMLQMIAQWLSEEKIIYMYLDGATEAMERARLVNRFNGGEGAVFLISLKAGGTGLNLTGADTVIHYDPWWNPAVEDQATDRAYRIGQVKSVHVMKLITRGTIEEKIYNLQERKKQLIDSVIQPQETLISKLSREEIMELFQ